MPEDTIQSKSSSDSRHDIWVIMTGVTFFPAFILAKLFYRHKEVYFYNEVGKKIPRGSVFKYGGLEIDEKFLPVGFSFDSEFDDVEVKFFRTEDGLLVVSSGVKEIIEKHDHATHQVFPMINQSDSTVWYGLNVFKEKKSIVVEKSSLKENPLPRLLGKKPSPSLFIDHLPDTRRLTLDFNKTIGSAMWRESGSPGSLLIRGDLMSELVAENAMPFPHWRADLI